jgi:hypothetical protein
LIISANKEIITKEHECWIEFEKQPKDIMMFIL